MFLDIFLLPLKVNKLSRWTNFTISPSIFWTKPKQASIQSTNFVYEVYNLADNIPRILSAAKIRQLSNRLSTPEAISPFIPPLPPFILLSKLFRTVIGFTTSILIGDAIEVHLICSEYLEKYTFPGPLTFILPIGSCMTNWRHSPSWRSIA